MRTHFKKESIPVIGKPLAHQLVSSQLLDSAGVRAKFGGRSDMWLWRRIKDGTLPRPLLIAGRRYWRSDELETLIARLSDVRGEQTEQA